MQLSRVPNTEKLEICREYFIGGCFCLPFLWLVNAVWFYDWAFRQPFFVQQSQIKKYVVYSGIGSVVWLCALIGWQLCYQIQRVSWGDFGDSISFNLPTGRI